MKIRDLFANWGISKIKVSAGFAELEWEPQDEDRKAAWDLYVELLTRVTTQPLSAEHGDEQTVLDSVFSLFATTRQVLKDNGPGCIQFSRIAIVVLNQVVRPFTAKWHRESIASAFESAAKCEEFRSELAELQIELNRYARALAQVADVEDLSQSHPDEETPTVS